MIDAAAPFLEATARTATPLALAALGELVAERAGVINIGVEGALIAGAFGALVGAGAGGVGAGFVMAVAAGCLTSAVFAVFVVAMRADQIITGAAVTLLGLGLTGVLYRTMYGVGGAALSIPTTGVLVIPVLSDLPLVGRALFAQPLTTYMLYALTPAMAWWMHRTHSGLALRAVGESPVAARAAGARPDKIRVAAILFGGGLAGLAGATLVLAQAGTFAEGMSAGRGFIAIAIVALGSWSPWRTLIAAVLFGAGFAMQTLLQSLGWEVPYQIFLALPYLLALAALAGAAGRTRAPGSLGRRTAQEE